MTKELPSWRSHHSQLLVTPSAEKAKGIESLELPSATLQTRGSRWPRSKGSSRWLRLPTLRSFRNAKPGRPDPAGFPQRHRNAASLGGSTAQKYQRSCPGRSRRVQLLRGRARDTSAQARRGRGRGRRPGLSPPPGTGGPRLSRLQVANIQPFPQPGFYYYYFFLQNKNSR